MTENDIVDLDAMDTTEPKSFRIGDTVTWTVSDHNYPASQGWTCKETFAGPSSFTVVSAPNGDAFDFTISKTDSASLIAGTYSMVRFFENATERHTTNKASVDILANLASITGNYDDRSLEEKLLDQVNDAITTLSSTPTATKTIKGEIYQYTDLNKLRSWRNSLMRIVQKQKGVSNKIKFEL